MRDITRQIAIKLLGPEFVALPVCAKLIGVWWCLALWLACCLCQSSPNWAHLLVFANFALASRAAHRMKRNKKRTK